MTSHLLSAERIREAFAALADRLRRRGVRGDLYVFGGAAMVMAYDAREGTRDVDAIWSPHGVIVEEAGVVAAALGLPGWWLNEQASSYVSQLDDVAKVPVFDHPNLRVGAASPRHMLAMKAFAGRAGRDHDDLVVLCRLLAITTADEVVAICSAVFPAIALGDRQLLAIANALETVAGDR